MRNSLQDQLLKAGLVDQKKLDQERRHKNKSRRKKGAKKAAATTPQPTPEQIEKAARDRELNLQREQVRRQREVAAQVKQLVRDNRHPRSRGEDDRPFHFENKGKVKRIYVSAHTHKMITDGKLVIVNDNGVFELVPSDTADKIRRRNPSLVVDLPEEEGPSADDPYAAYQVPDDLTW
jgi:uncharacterized protein YaiL (DUF2058 family)